jgi:uncharacterized iron-regulated membrane protein
MPFRTVFFWFHLATGLAAGAIVLVMSVTGVLLMYEKQVVQWAESGPNAAPPSPAARRLPIETVLRSVRSRRPGVTPSTVTVSSAPDAPAVVALGRDAGVLLVNGYTGEVIGSGSGVRAFFRGVTDWHRWLGQSGDGRAAGRAVTGCANLAFLFLLLSGAYIWLPRMWTWQKIRVLMWFRDGGTPKARDFNWHHVFGLWMVVPLVIVVASGAVISYPWASALVYRVAGEAPPSPPAGPPRGEGEARRQGRGQRPNDSTALSLDGLNRSWARAEGIEGWRTLALRVPSPRDRQVTITVDHGTGGQPHKRAQLTVDRATGAVVSWEPFQSLSPGRRLRSILRFAHTGEVLGLVGQTIAGVASFAAVMLVYTGVALSVRRFAAWRRRRQSVQEPRAITAA